MKRWPISLSTGVALLLVLVSVAGAADWLYPTDPLELVGAPFIRPGEDPLYPMGTDMMGRDIASGIVHGARVTLLIGLIAAIVAALLGTLIGLAAGYLGGWVDHLLMRVAELFQVIPHFLFAIMLVSIMGPTLTHIILAIGITAWPGVARIVRAEAMTLRERDYVKVSEVMGAGHVRILLTHILPNAASPVLVAASLLTAMAVLTEAGLAYLGLGDSNYVSWGGMIGSARDALIDAPYMTVLPGMATLLVVLALSLIGDGMARYLRPGHDQ